MNQKLNLQAPKADILKPWFPMFIFGSVGVSGGSLKATEHGQAE